MTPPSSSGEGLSFEGLANIVPREIQRTMQRQVKGLEYLVSSETEAGQTPRREIYSRGTLRLYQYLPQTDEVYRVPVILIMSLVSKSYIFDLAPGQSLVEYLVRQGFDVYLIDWGTPRAADKRLRLEDYVQDFIPDCIERVCADSGEDEVSLVAYCMGGMLAVMHEALYPDGPVKNLACFTTPVDFDGMGLFKAWTNPEYFDADEIVDTMGNVPAEILLASFDMLRPASKITGQIRLWDNMWNDDFVTGFRRVDRWSNDQIPMAGETFRQTTKELQQQNKLIKGEFHLGGRLVDLAQVKIPLLHAVAEFDHIVPYEAARHLVTSISSEDKTEMVMKGGHVSLVAGPKAVHRLWPSISEWLSGRSV